MVNTRKQAIKANFIQTFTRAFGDIHNKCVRKSSWLESIGQHARTAGVAGAAFFLCRSIPEVDTPYGHVRCNPVPCIALLACCQTYRVYQRAEKARNLVNFFNAYDDDQRNTLIEEIANQLYNRFEFVLEILENNASGVEKLAQFFVRAMAENLKQGLTSDESEAANTSILMQAALPERGASVYRRFCLLKHLKLAHREYLTALPGHHNEIFRRQFRRHYSIEALINDAPAYLVEDDQRLYIKGGSGGEYIFPPQRIMEATGFTPHQQVTFSHISYAAINANFLNTTLSANDRKACLKLDQQVAKNVTPDDFQNRLEQIRQKGVQAQEVQSVGPSASRSCSWFFCCAKSSAAYEPAHTNGLQRI